MTGTMGLGLAAFVPIWTLMMAAMMLPSATPTATLCAKTMQRNRAMRITGLVAGYLAVWAVAGLPAYGLAWLAGWLTGTHPAPRMSWPWRCSRSALVRAAALALAVATIWLSWLAPGLQAAARMD